MTKTAQEWACETADVVMEAARDLDRNPLSFLFEVVRELDRRNGGIKVSLAKGRQVPLEVRHDSG